ncbi:hypothetical protein [Chlorogloeopsis sp. ULAP02]|uniref:hypothetical protein n=1 Tax=Chlorogloeopsis sp. ULAP02 TaxID=3107926 RepID=UPI0031356A4E
MIHHISIAVQNPQHVAHVLAEILHGKALPFPPVLDSYMVLVGDEFGSLIELYPLGAELIPDAWQGQAGCQINEHPSHYTPVHAAISVPSSLEEIEQIGAREGWRVLPCNREGIFDVIEFWVENRLMLEFLTPAIAPKYLNAFSPEQLELFAEQFAMAYVRK